MNEDLFQTFVELLNNAPSVEGTLGGTKPRHPLGQGFTVDPELGPLVRVQVLTPPTYVRDRVVHVTQLTAVGSLRFQPEFDKDAMTLLIEAVERDFVRLESGAEPGELLHQGILFCPGDFGVVGCPGLTLRPLLVLFLLPGFLPGTLFETLSAPLGQCATATSTGARFGDVDLQLTAIELSAVESRDGAVCLVAALHLDESETA
jgi:hypothetical protein